MATKADLEALFREADVDGNNYLTLDELCVAMRKLGYKGDDAVIKVRQLNFWSRIKVCHYQMYVDDINDIK